MPTRVTMKGLIEPVVIDEGFIECTNKLNIAAANGKQFVITKAEDNGENLVLNINEILTLRQVDTEDSERVPEAF